MTDLTTRTDTLRASPLGELLEADLPTRLAALEALCEAVAGGDIQDERDQHTGPELGRASVRVHRACARLTGKRYQWLAVEEADGRWATTVFHPRTYASHVAHSHGISYRHARDIVRLARQLRDEIPRFGAALRAGTIGPDHVHAIASTALTSPTRIAALDEPVELSNEHSTSADGEGEGEGEGEGGSGEQTTTRSVSVETFLLAQARDMRPEKVRQLGKYFAHAADPDADDRGYSKAKEREHLELVRTLDGWHLSGFLTEENGRLVRTAIDAVMTPPAPDDHRTADQRRAQALADLAHLVLDKGLAGSRASVRPHLGVLIGPHDFERLLRESGASRTGGAGQRKRSERSKDNRGREQDSSEHRHSDCPTAGPPGAEQLANPPAPGRQADGRPDRKPDRESDQAPDRQVHRRPDRKTDQNRQPDPAPDANSTGREGPAVRSRSAPPGHRSGATDWDPAALTELANIDWTTRLTDKPPTFDDGTGPVPPGLLRRLAGCGDVYRVLFSPEGEVINHGRVHRLFTAAQRRALVARDRGCTWPGCTAPPSICESHHARVHWADGGPTDVANGALLCYHHHGVVDARSIEMTRQGGIWIFTRPDGTILNTDRHETAPSEAAVRDDWWLAR